MTTYDKDAVELLRKIRKHFDKFSKKLDQHQRDESFISVDNQNYTVIIKVQSPFGNGQSTEEIVSTNELQQRVNYWLGIQREIGRLASLRLIITPEFPPEE